MRYRVSIPEPHTHLIRVVLEVTRPGDGLECVFPVWTPGSYLVREFARHVEGFAAEDATGRPLHVDRLDKHRFRVAAQGVERAVVRYAVYANDLSVRTSHVDGTHAFLNGANVFCYVPGRQWGPHEVEVSPPPGWHVSTALDGGPCVFTARDYDELADSPIEIGTHRLARFEALGKAHEIALWGRGNVDVDRLVADTRRIVEAAAALMGGLPYERYLFIVHLVDRRRGGLEHERSTALQVGRTSFFPRKAYEETLALVAHEFFHLWNVKRLRPAAFRPFDYGREQYTRLLWWFEGATSHYENVILARAGLLSPRRWLAQLGRAFTQLERTPGAGKMGLEEASLTAWVKYYRPDENSNNSAVSYYLKGELVALALDLELRRAGGSLDDVLRRLYARHAEAGLPEDGVERAVAEVLGERPARDLFDRWVRGTEPLEPGLDVIGLALRRRAAVGFDDKGGVPAPPVNGDGGPPPGWLGATLAPGPRLEVAWVAEGSPAHRAGLYAGDEIVAEDGFRVDRAGLWDRLCERGPEGRLRLTVFRRDELIELVVPLGPAPEDTVWLEPVAEPTEAQRAAFGAWSGNPLPRAL
ncbi:MAG TPA: PDZ domain-containing protein [Anaeromyxobacteraceae bacterium]|nr:PDZ domain-containing protein [Anaeromyxobacteraceae bacterium]